MSHVGDPQRVGLDCYGIPVQHGQPAVADPYTYHYTGAAPVLFDTEDPRILAGMGQAYVNEATTTAGELGNLGAYPATPGAAAMHQQQQQQQQEAFNPLLAAAAAPVMNAAEAHQQQQQQQQAMENAEAQFYQQQQQQMMAQAQAQMYAQAQAHAQAMASAAQAQSQAQAQLSQAQAQLAQVQQQQISEAAAAARPINRTPISVGAPAAARVSASAPQATAAAAPAKPAPAPKQQQAPAVAAQPAACGAPGREEFSGEAAGYQPLGSEGYDASSHELKQVSVRFQVQWNISLSDLRKTPAAATSSISPEVMQNAIGNAIAKSLPPEKREAFTGGKYDLESVYLRRFKQKGLVQNTLPKNFLAVSGMDELNTKTSASGVNYMADVPESHTQVNAKSKLVDNDETMKSDLFARYAHASSTRVVKHELDLTGSVVPGAVGVKADSTLAHSMSGAANEARIRGVLAKKGSEAGFLWDGRALAVRSYRGNMHNYYPPEVVAVAVALYHEAHQSQIRLIDLANQAFSVTLVPAVHMSQFDELDTEGFSEATDRARVAKRGVVTIEFEAVICFPESIDPERHRQARLTVVDVGAAFAGSLRAALGRNAGAVGSPANVVPGSSSSSSSSSSSGSSSSVTKSGANK